MSSYKDLVERAVALLETTVEHDDKIQKDDGWYAMDNDDREAIDEFLVEAKLYV